MVSESCGEDRAPIVPSENLGKKRALLGLPEVSGKKFWIFWIFPKCWVEIDSCAFSISGEEVNSY